MKNEMSAKDKAFDKERVRYRHQINELNAKIKKMQEKELLAQDEQQREKAKVREQDEWIERLIEYMDIPKEDLQRKMQSSAKVDDLIASIKTLTKTYPYAGFAFSSLFSDLNER